MKYRIKEETIDGIHTYYPQYRYKFIPIWFNFTYFDGSKVCFIKFVNATTYIHKVSENKRKPIVNIKYYNI